MAGKSSKKNMLMNAIIRMVNIYMYVDKSKDE